MQVSKWLGHSTFTLTLDTYGDYIPEQDGGALNTLPEPPAPMEPVEKAGNVLKIVWLARELDGEIPGEIWSPFVASPAKICIQRPNLARFLAMPHSAMRTDAQMSFVHAPMTRSTLSIGSR